MNNSPLVHFAFQLHPHQWGSPSKHRFRQSGKRSARTDSADGLTCGDLPTVRRVLSSRCKSEAPRPLTEANNSHKVNNGRGKETGARAALYFYCAARKVSVNEQVLRKPETDYEVMFCEPSAPALAPGESRVGFYHTHTPASIAGFSPGDIQAAEASGRQYYVISTLTGCARRYNPQTNANTQLGCFPGQY